MKKRGMTGALNLKGGILQGQILLNLDTEEDDDEIDIGCAGGIDVTASAEFDEEETPDGSVGYKITVKGRWSLWNGYSQRTWECEQNYEPFIV
jgi:dipeptidase D